MHLVTDPKGYTAALERGIPFYRTACGEAHPMAELTTEPTLVNCGGCAPAARKLMNGASASSAPVVPGPQVDRGMVDDETFADFDEVEAVLGIGGKSPSGQGSAHVGSSDAASSPGAVDVIGSLGPMLEMAMAGFSPDFPEWRRWLIPPNTEDPDGQLGEHDQDLREMLSMEELLFLGQLGQLSSMIGADGLPQRVLSIIHRLADRVAELEGLVVLDDDGEGDEEGTDVEEED